ncbi:MULTISPECIES: efflux transporter outer membrane subunit [unclassified Roseovarius]|uniref:efflux transporter outer membrane subunit n=1 Tax=unclassified Roseovarius TaxID=2614913 RepID=UPI00273EF9C2|nr:MULTISPECIES: efflux transporter outer membrane subunit [unclassified Roseovarius]
MRIVLTIGAGLILSGCTVGPMYKTPEIDLPDRYSLVAPVTKASTRDLNWWTDFNDPVLNTLVREGMEGNLDVAEARERVREAEANVRRDSVALSGNGEVEATGNSRAGENVQVSLTGAFGLGGRTQWATRAANQRLEAAEIGVGEARRLLLSNLGTAYVDMRFLQRNLETRQQDLRSRRRTLRDLNKQLDVGAATKLDVLRAEALVSETQAEIPAITADIIQQRNRISTLLGVPVGELGVDLGYKGTQPQPRGVAEMGVPADLLRARPDIRLAERNYAAAVSDVGVAEASRYPSLSLSGLVTAPLNSGSWNESIVAGLSVPVFSQPSLKASAEGAESRAQQAYLVWRRTVLVAIEQVETALAELRAANQAVRASRKVVELNQRSLDLTRRLLVENGDTTVLDLIDRERSVSNARAILAANKRDLANAYIALRVALGVGHEEVVDEVTRNSVMTVDQIAVE